MSPLNADDPILTSAAFIEGAAQGLRLATDENAASPLQFFDNLRMGLLSSIELGAPSAGAASIFVLVDRPREIAQKLGGANKVFDIDFQPSSQWENKLIFAAKQGTNGWGFPLENGNLADTVKKLIDAKLGGYPMATVYPQKATMSCLILGADSDDTPLRLSLPATPRPVTAANLIEVLELVRTEALITPAVCPPFLWKDAKNYIPDEQTERTLQWCVASEMRAFFRPILPEREQSITVGRIDICLTNLKPGVAGNPYPAIVELKALRSMSHEGNPVSEYNNMISFVRGMRQTKAYKTKKNAPIGILACFDLRKKKTDLLSRPTILKAVTKYGYDDTHLLAKMLKIYGDPDHAQEELATA